MRDRARPGGLARRGVRADGNEVTSRSASRTAVAKSAEFDEILALIEAARNRAYQAVNTELVSLYWQLGEYISEKIASAEWGEGVVDDLAATIASAFPGVRGFTRRNLFRMRQFYDAYRGQEKVSPLLTQLPWTHHLIILGQAKSADEREFYMLAAIKGHWTSRELEASLFQLTRKIRFTLRTRSTRPNPPSSSA